MIENKAFTNKWWHIVYKIFFLLFVAFIIIAIIELQPSADVPAPTIYGIALIVIVDTLYYERIVRMITGHRGNGMIRRYFSY